MKNLTHDSPLNFPNVLGWIVYSAHQIGSAHSASLPALEQYGTEPLLLYFLQGMNESEPHTQVRVRISAEKT